ncbi:MAG TPA: hypothetical protein V6C97_11030 [Oculatellaceae cyanobacterium]
MLKSIFVVAVAGVCLYAALVLMPWSELNFGFDLKAIPEWSHGLVNSPLMSPLASFGHQASDYLKAKGAESQFGDYMYALVIFVILTLVGIAYVVVGREEAEEKMYLPIKK